MIRYKPGEAVRWIETGAQDLRRSAKRQGQRVVNREGDRNVGRDLRDAAGAIIDLGKSAIAEIQQRQIQANEYVFHDDRLEVVSPARITSIKYDQIQYLKLKHEELKIVLEHGSIVMKPHAYILSGRIKIPIGWNRNGMEVPYETILDELSGRSGVNIEHL